MEVLKLLDLSGHGRFLSDQSQQLGLELTDELRLNVFGKGFQLLAPIVFGLLNFLDRVLHLVGVAVQLFQSFAKTCCLSSDQLHVLLVDFIQSLEGVRLVLVAKHGTV